MSMLLAERFWKYDSLLAELFDCFQFHPMRMEVTELWSRLPLPATAARRKTPHSSVESEPDHFSALIAANITNCYN